jgi:hypothetical protein
MNKFYLHLYSILTVILNYQNTFLCTQFCFQLSIIFLDLQLLIKFQDSKLKFKNILFLLIFNYSKHVKFPNLLIISFHKDFLFYCKKDIAFTN